VNEAAIMIGDIHSQVTGFLAINEVEVACVHLILEGLKISIKRMIG
jgi:hypothetical protein